MRFVSAMTLIAGLSLAWPAAGADKPLVLDLWSGLAPDEVNTGIGKEYTRPSPKLDRKTVEVTESTLMITNVTKPTITIYRPDKDKDTGTAVVICPGGGYWNLYWQLEGEEVATWLNSLGVTGIILKYRVPRRPDDVRGEPARRALQDSQRAISLIRSKAKEWGINPDRIGITGFSAGGHLAIATATSFEKRTYTPSDDIDKVSCRPDFAIPVYSGYLRAKEKLDPATAASDPKARAKEKDELSPALSVPKETPPVFLVHGDVDIESDPRHSVVMYLALKRAGISAELHIYAGSTHDFGVRKNDHLCSNWTQACADWMRYHGFLKPGKQP